MRSRDLPAFRTLPGAWPRAVVEAFDDHLRMSVPTGVAWVLDEPPDDVGSWLHRADGAELWWEDRLAVTRPVAGGPAVRAVDGAVPVPEGRALVEHCCFLHDQALEPERPEGVSDLADLDAAVALAVGSGQPERFARWQLEGHLERREEGLGAVLVTGPAGAPTGLVSVTWGAREARVQGLVVAAEARRTGLARRLAEAAFVAWQEVSFGNAYAVAPVGSGAAALFRACGMRPVTSVWQVTRAPHRLEGA